MKISFRAFTSILLFGTFLSILIGVMVYGMRIFNPAHPLFQFISYGFIGSLSFALFKTQKYMVAFLILVACFFGLFYLTGGHFIFTHVLFYFGLIISQFIFAVLIFDHLESAKYLRPLILATILSFFFVSNTFILSLIYDHTVTSGIVFKNMFIGLLIGLGTGVGIEVACMLVKREEACD